MSRSCLCSRDSAAAESSTGFTRSRPSNISGSTVTVPAPAGGAGDGAQLVQAYAVDNCNNAEVPPVSVTVNICTKGADTSAFAPASVKKGKKLKIGYECDSITPTVTATMKIYKSSGSVAKSFNIGQKNANLD